MILYIVFQPWLCIKLWCVETNSHSEFSCKELVQVLSFGSRYCEFICFCRPAAADAANRINKTEGPVHVPRALTSVDETEAETGALFPNCWGSNYYTQCWRPGMLSASEFGSGFYTSCVCTRCVCDRCVCAGCVCARCVYVQCVWARCVCARCVCALNVFAPDVLAPDESSPGIWTQVFAPRCLCPGAFAQMLAQECLCLGDYVQVLAPRCLRPTHPDACDGPTQPGVRARYVVEFFVRLLMCAGAQGY